MIKALLISEWCTPCELTTDHELSTNGLQTECLTCKHTESVSEHYVRQMLADES